MYGQIVVRWRPPAQGLPGESKRRIDANMLQLQTGGRRETPSVQLPRLQPRQGGDPQTTTGKLFTSNYRTSGLSFAEALRNNAGHQQQRIPSQDPVAGPPAGIKLSTSASGQQQKSGQSVRAPIVNSQPLDNMLRVVTAVQQMMTEFSGAVSVEDKIVAITKIVLNLMKQNGH
jgi:hypothetical protein